VGDVALTIEREGAQLCDYHDDLPFFRSHAIVLRGWALVEQGQCEEGIAQLGEGLVAYRATGAELECSHWLALLAEAYRDNGQPEEGLRLITEALDHVAQTGIVYYEAELHRLDAAVPLRERLRPLQDRVLSRPATGLEADKAFYDELSGDP